MGVAEKDWEGNLECDQTHFPPMIFEHGVSQIPTCIDTYIKTEFWCTYIHITYEVLLYLFITHD